MVDHPLQAATGAIQGLVKTKENLESCTRVLDRLESMVHVSRAAKAPDVKVANVTIQTRSLPGNIGEVVQVTAQTGDAGQYNTRVTFAPKNGFRCTCPDLERRHQACKHVAALAVECRKRFWALSDLLMVDIDKLGKERDELEALYISLPLLTTNLTTKAGDALTSSLQVLVSTSPTDPRDPPLSAP